MDAWLIYDEYEAEKNKYYIQLYFDECKKRSINLRLLICEKINIKIIDSKFSISYKNEHIATPSFAICRTINPMLSQQLEYMKIPVYNNAFVSSICNNKMKTYQYVSSFGIEIMNTSFANKKIENIKYPFVIKPVDGKGGKNVCLIENENEYDKVLSLLGNSECVIQSVASDIGKDLRVYVIDKKIIASIIRISNSDFRSNFCLGGTAELYKLSNDEIKIVKSIIDMFDFGFVGIDFVFNNGKMIFNEIEDVVGARMIYAKTNINVVSEYLDYILSRI